MRRLTVLFFLIFASGCSKREAASDPKGLFERAKAAVEGRDAAALWALSSTRARQRQIANAKEEQEVFRKSPSSARHFRELHSLTEDPVRMDPEALSLARLRLVLQLSADRFAFWQATLQEVKGGGESATLVIAHRDSDLGPMRYEVPVLREDGAWRLEDSGPGVSAAAHPKEFFEHVKAVAHKRDEPALWRAMSRRLRHQRIREAEALQGEMSANPETKQRIKAEHFLEVDPVAMDGEALARAMLGAELRTNFDAFFLQNPALVEVKGAGATRTWVAETKDRYGSVHRHEVRIVQEDDAWRLDE